MGTKAAGINAADENFDFSDEAVAIEEGTNCMFTEDKQFYARAEKSELFEKTGMCIWIRCHLIVDDRIIWFTLLQENRRLWEFETFRGKQRIIQRAIEEQFDIVLASQG